MPVLMKRSRVNRPFQDVQPPNFGAQVRPVRFDTLSENERRELKLFGTHCRAKPMADRRGVMMSLRHDLQRIQHFWCDRSSHLQIEVTLEFLQCGPGFLADNAIR